MKQNEITHNILNAAYKVHTELGPGLLESAYENCLASRCTTIGIA